MDSECFTDKLHKTLSQLNDKQKEEIDLIESIINVNKETRENVVNKIIKYVGERRPENCINYIIRIISHAALIRPKVRPAISFLLRNVFMIYLSGFQISDERNVVNSMLQIEKVFPADDKIAKHVFDFADDGTVGKAIFDDDLELLMKLLEEHPDEGKDRVYSLQESFMFSFDEREVKANRIEIAMLFGSIKCFLYLMCLGDKIDEDMCNFAIAGGNKEIIHILKERQLSFENCWDASLVYHRFDLFETSGERIGNPEITLAGFLRNFNEPLFYYYSLSGSNVDERDSDENTPITIASEYGSIEIVKYLYETCQANIETKDIYGCTPINIASYNGHLDIVRYLYETCHADIESKNDDGCTPLNVASKNNGVEIIKYLHETCHADIETKDYDGNTPINIASKYNSLEAVKYLYETCQADFEARDRCGYTPINNASEAGNLCIVQYLYEKSHANVEKRNSEGNTPIINASQKGHLEVVQYLYEKCHADVEAKNNDGKTAIDIASEENHQEIVKYLNDKCHSKTVN